MARRGLHINKSRPDAKWIRQVSNRGISVIRRGGAAIGRDQLCGVGGLIKTGVGLCGKIARLLDCDARDGRRLYE